MGEIIVVVTLKKTVSPLTGAAFDVVQTWIKTNIIDKLPPDTEQSYQITMNP
jgi:hypothetical protein